MAISSQIEDLGDGEERPSLKFLESSGGAAAVKVDSGLENDKMEKSTREGSIYRTKQAGADLTYLFAISVKSEGAQVDIVTVRTVIKGLRRSRFWRYFTIQDLLVGPSVVLSNGNIADGRIKWRDSVQGVEEFEEYARESG